jgi:hypothetical protein
MEVFIVRVWPERDVLRGRVEHVPSGRAQIFHDADSLCAFLAAAHEAEPPVVEEGTPSR